MASPQGSGFLAPLQHFADALRTSYASGLGGQAEDQLKAPVGDLLREFGSGIGLGVLSATEAPLPGVGRPDVAVGANGLLCGFVELKAPGTGADARKFKGRNKQQFQKFSSIPNLVYTDGNEWALYREGKRAGFVALSGDAAADGAKAASQKDADDLSVLLRDFLTWDPISPKSPKALAEMLAPLCHLLRDDVLGALGDPDSNLSALARE